MTSSAERVDLPSVRHRFHPVNKPQCITPVPALQPPSTMWRDRCYRHHPFSSAHIVTLFSFCLIFAFIFPSLQSASGLETFRRRHSLPEHPIQRVSRRQFVNTELHIGKQCILYLPALANSDHTVLPVFTCIIEHPNAPPWASCFCGPKWERCDGCYPTGNKKPDQISMRIPLKFATDVTEFLTSTLFTAGAERRHAGQRDARPSGDPRSLSSLRSGQIE